MTRTLVIGDIHGCFQSLMTLAKEIPIAEEDLVITLGDYIDRGPASYQVIEWLIERKKTGQLVSILGNHERMLLDAKENPLLFGRWFNCGGKETLASYSPLGDTGKLVDVPDSHWDFFESCVKYHELDSHFFVHGCAYPDYPMDEQPDYMILWEKFDQAAPHESGKVMVCGHTPQKSGRPVSLGFAQCIDTWVYGDGWLTCLDIQSQQYWQANEKGKFRSDFLSPEYE
ncbi:MAG: metallophosphoesterase family protein [Planctomycetota bacterium]|nr:metallophosphoesterase family protein [Planctomycetota bacterium]